MRTKIKQVLENQKDFINRVITICGWIKTVRSQKEITFIEINDGSIFSNMQVVLQGAQEELTNGTSVSITGKIVKSPGKEQNIEMQAEGIQIFGTCPQEEYPLQKKRHSFEFLREIAHLRPRTNTQGAVARVRNEISFATHKFFQSRGFLYIHTPIITASDCEGGGEMFRVTTLDPSITDFSKDFFSRPAYLTVSGQLNAEIFACALSDVYTFGPTFRAEKSNTSRHLAEFWMIEPEMAFADLQDNMECAESYVKYLIESVLNNCSKDIEFFDKFIKPGQIKYLEKFLKDPFERITYTEAIDILKKANQKFEFPVKWGIDLQSEHERYLCEKHFGTITIVSNYPKEIKAFYMRADENGKTVSAMDMLAPAIGEIIGGSQREERLNVLKQKIKEFKLKEEDYWWYLELRKYGTVPHSGFGLGLERAIQFITGVENIRDVIPFPRFPGHAEF